jgi:hypothetical protein
VPSFSGQDTGLSLRRAGFDSPWHRLLHLAPSADIAQPAERDPAMVEAAGSNPAVRFIITPFVERPKTPGSEPGDHRFESGTGCSSTDA